MTIQNYLHTTYGKKVNEFIQLTPLYNQYGIGKLSRKLYNSLKLEEIKHVSTFAKLDDVGIYPIIGNYTNIFLVPITENELFTVCEKHIIPKYNNLLNIDSVRAAIHEFTPYIRVSEEQCYFNIFKGKFDYNQNNVIIYNDWNIFINKLNARYPHIKNYKLIYVDYENYI